MKTSKLLKKVLAVLMTVALLAGTGFTSFGEMIGTTVSVNAELPDDEWDFYECTGGYSVTLTKYLGNDMHVNVPTRVNWRLGRYVENLAWAFRGVTCVKSVTVPDGIALSTGAFGNCPNLQTVDLPSDLTGIAGMSFYNCPSLTSISIPNSVEVIDDHAFQDCVSLESIHIPRNVKAIREAAFRGCTNLKSITVDPDNEYYCSVDGVLYNKDKTKLIQYPCGKSDTSFTIPASVTEISYEKIIEYGDSSATTVTTPFTDCKNLLNIYVAEGNTAFRSVDGVLLKYDVGTLYAYPPGRVGAYTIPLSVAYVEQAAFKGCTGLTSVVITQKPASEIKQYAFDGCTNLSSVTLPAQFYFGRIGSYAFRNCTNLSDVYYEGSQAQWDYAAGWNYIPAILKTLSTT